MGLRHGVASSRLISHVPAPTFPTHRTIWTPRTFWATLDARTQIANSAGQQSRPVRTPKPIRPLEAIRTCHSIRPSPPTRTCQATQPSRPLETCHSIRPFPATRTCQATRPNQAIRTCHSIRSSPATRPGQATQPSRPLETCHSIRPSPATRTCQATRPSQTIQPSGASGPRWASRTASIRAGPGNTSARLPRPNGKQARRTPRVQPVARS